MKTCPNLTTVALGILVFGTVAPHAQAQKCTFLRGEIAASVDVHTGVVEYTEAKSSSGEARQSIRLMRKWDDGGSNWLFAEAMAFIEANPNRIFADCGTVFWAYADTAFGSDTFTFVGSASSMVEYTVNEPTWSVFSAGFSPNSQVPNGSTSETDWSFEFSKLNPDDNTWETILARGQGFPLEWPEPLFMTVGTYRVTQTSFVSIQHGMKDYTYTGIGRFTDFWQDFTLVPEPSSLLALLGGCGGTLACRRARRKTPRR